MQNLELNNLEKALKQIEKYNEDFKHYFLCLKTANYQIKELSREIKKISNINLSKTRSHKSLRKVARLLQQASLINKNSYTPLEQELINLKEIVKYLKGQQPQFEELSKFVLKTEAEAEAEAHKLDPIIKKGSIKLIINIKKLNQNINLCENYIFPKNQNLLEVRKGVQTRLKFKQNNLQMHFAPKQMQETN